MKRGWKLSVAESCTGGLLGAAITSVAGSSAYFAGGVISYANEVKISLLSVPRICIEQYGAVSSQTVEAMVRGVATLMGTECALSISGVAGPDGGTDAKPVGLVYIGVKVQESVTSIECRFTGDREQVRTAAVSEALNILIARLEDLLG